MPITRYFFPITITAGPVLTPKGDTGYVTGALQQMRWYPTTVDTGQTATLTVAIIPSIGSSDTGVGWNIYSVSHGGTNGLGIGITRAPRQISHDAGGGSLDTGGGSEPVIFAGDKLRVKVTPADTGVQFSGKLYVWTFD